MAIIAASILDSDFTNLQMEIQRADRAGVDMFTLDIMDGHFAPRITFGDLLFANVREWTKLPMEAHLMVAEPELWAERFIDVGADLVVFHLEATERPGAIIDAVRSAERAVGIALLSHTPVDRVMEWVPHVDVVNFLAVPVGFGGQASAPDTHDRIRSLRSEAAKRNPDLVIEVDGGVKPHNADTYVHAGADMLTVGTGLYKAPDMKAAVKELRERTGGPEDALARRRGRSFLEPRPPSPEAQDRKARRLRELADQLDAHPPGSHREHLP